MTEMATCEFCEKTVAKQGLRDHQRKNMNCHVQRRKIERDRRDALAASIQEMPPPGPTSKKACKGVRVSNQPLSVLYLSRAIDAETQLQASETSTSPAATSDGTPNDASGLFDEAVRDLHMGLLRDL